MLTEQDGVLGIECDGRFIPAISGGWVASTTAATIAIYATIISVVMSIAAAAMQYMQQQQAAEAQQRNQDAMMKAQDAAIAQNAALANRAYMEDTKTIQEAQRQKEEIAVDRELDVSVNAAQARSTALTAAGESGVSGQSVNMLLNDFTRQEVDYRFQSQTQVGYERDQMQRDLEAAQIKSEGRTQSMKPYQAQPVQYPSLLGAGLRVGADVAGKAYGAYRARPEVPAAGATGLGADYYSAGNGQYM